MQSRKGIFSQVKKSTSPNANLVALIIGAGNMGKLMTKILKENGHEVVGIISEKGETAKSLAQDYNKDNILSGKWDQRDTIWGALSHHEDKINLIVLAVPPNKVFECAQWSLQKCHVFTRGNPISRVEVETLNALAKSNNHLFLGRSEKLFSPVHLKAKDLLKVEKDGDIIEKKGGEKIISIESYFSLVPEEALWYTSAEKSGDITIAHSIFDMQVAMDLISDPSIPYKSLLPTFAFATGDLRDKSNADSVLNFCKATLCWGKITYTAITSYLPPLDPSQTRYIKLLFSSGKELLITHETNKPGGSLKWIKNEENKQKAEDVKIEGLDKDPFVIQFEESAKLIALSQRSKEKGSPSKTSIEKEITPSPRCLFINATRDIILMEKLRESAREQGMKKICEFNGKAENLSEVQSLSHESALRRHGYLSFS